MSRPEPIPRVVNFEKLAFGLFVHWGLYSIPGKGAWMMGRGLVDRDTYRALRTQFSAEHYDPRHWARMAKQAGMKYITLTTRHHDGFSLYDTRGLNDWDAPHSAAGRDLVAEFVRACRAEGIVPFFYHTTLDWHHDAFKQDFPAYLQYLRDSVEILCTQYGDIGGFWFDGYWSRFDVDWEEDALYELIRRHQPNAILVNNPGWQRNGQLTHRDLDSMTWEAELPKHPIDRNGMKKYVACEAEARISHWGHFTYSFNAMAPEEIIRALCHCRNCESNYLLNVSPRGDGSIPKLQEGILEMVGVWMAENGKAIYNSKPCGVTGSGDNVALQSSDGPLFLFVVDTDKPVAFSGITQNIRSMCWLDNGETIAFSLDREAGLLSFVPGPTPYSGAVPRVAELSL